MRGRIVYELSIGDMSLETHAVKGPVSPSSSSPSSSSQLCSGLIVEYKRDASSRANLALITVADGKVNWFGLCADGRRQSIAPKQVVLIMAPGKKPFGNESDVVDRMAREAEEFSSSQEGLIDSTWDLLAGEGGSEGQSASLTDLAELMVEEDSLSPSRLYQVYKLLQSERGMAHFKPQDKGPLIEGCTFKPRPAAEVIAARTRLDELGERRRDGESFAALLKEASASSKKQTTVGVMKTSSGQRHQKKFESLLDLVFSSESSPISPETLNLATDTLKLASTVFPSAKASASLRGCATALLRDLGVLRRHEPIDLLRHFFTPLASSSPSSPSQNPSPASSSGSHADNYQDGGVRRVEDILDLPLFFTARAAEILSSPPVDHSESHRVDLTHLDVFTIDDEGTLEVDDGLSIEEVEGGRVRVWIHVADPTRWLSPGDPLDSEARRRIRTLYLPYGFIPCFPRVLATGVFSLAASSSSSSPLTSSSSSPPMPRDALSFGVVLNVDGLIEDIRIVPSKVLVKDDFKMDYKAVDQALSVASSATSDSSKEVENDSCDESRSVRQLCALARLAEIRRSYRLNRGGIEIPLPELDLSVPVEDLDLSRPKVEASRSDPHLSTSRQMVAEFMILAGEAAGAYGQSRGLPLPYRGQEAPVLPSEEEMDLLPLEGPCRAYAMRTKMTRSTMTSTPKSHASLGLDAYVQVTSPIRRYPDVLAHFNLKADLMGLPLPFSAPSIDAILSIGQEGAKALNMLERDQTQYWLGEYLRRQGGGERPWQATFLGWFRKEIGLGAVLIDEIGYETITKVDKAFDAQPGDSFQLVLVDGQGGGGGGGKGGADGVAQLRFSIVAHMPRQDPEDEGIGLGGDDDDELSQSTEESEDD